MDQLSMRCLKQLACRSLDKRPRSPEPFWLQGPLLCFLGSSGCRQLSLSYPRNQTWRVCGAPSLSFGYAALSPRRKLAIYLTTGTQAKLRKKGVKGTLKKKKKRTSEEELEGGRERQS